MARIQDQYRDEYDQLLELRKGYRIMQLRDESHEYTWDELCKWIDEADERLKEIEEMSKSFDLSLKINNINNKWSSL